MEQVLEIPLLGGAICTSFPLRFEVLCHGCFKHSSCVRQITEEVMGSFWFYFSISITRHSGLLIAWVNSNLPRRIIKETQRLLSEPTYCATMGTEGPKDSLDWKTIGDSAKNEHDTGPVVKKRLPKRMRHIPDYYFLSRRSMFANIAIYGSCIVGGIGAGMLTEYWINKKVNEDGNGVLWEFDK